MLPWQPREYSATCGEMAWITAGGIAGAVLMVFGVNDIACQFDSCFLKAFNIRFVVGFIAAWIGGSVVGGVVHSHFQGCVLIRNKRKKETRRRQGRKRR